MWPLESLRLYMWIVILFLSNSAALELDYTKFLASSASFCYATLEKLLNPSVPLFLPLKVVINNTYDIKLL